MQLCFYDCDGTAKFLKGSFGFFGSSGDESLKYRHMSFTQEFFCLVFVNFHQ